MFWSNFSELHGTVIDNIADINIFAAFLNITRRSKYKQIILLI